MAAKITTEPFGSIPPHQRHAVTIHMPTWDTMMRFADRDMELIKQFKNFYPRIMLHKDVKEVSSVPSLSPTYH
jgi:cystathionine gamma-synthase